MAQIRRLPMEELIREALRLNSVDAEAPSIRENHLRVVQSGPAA